MRARIRNAGERSPRGGSPKPTPQAHEQQHGIDIRLMALESPTFRIPPKVGFPPPSKTRTPNGLGGSGSRARKGSGTRKRATRAKRTEVLANSAGGTESAPASAPDSVWLLRVSSSSSCAISESRARLLNVSSARSVGI